MRDIMFGGMVWLEKGECLRDISGTVIKGPRLVSVKKDAFHARTLVQGFGPGDPEVRVMGTNLKAAVDDCKKD